MAPEVEEKSKVQPRSRPTGGQPTGQVLLYLLNRSRKENTDLRTIARKLTIGNPERRWSMLQVAAPLSEVANVAVERKISQSLPNTVKFDGEDAKPPMVKK
jgi:hypothetical protein